MSPKLWVKKKRRNGVLVFDVNVAVCPQIINRLKGPPSSALYSSQFFQSSASTGTQLLPRASCSFATIAAFKFYFLPSFQALCSSSILPPNIVTVADSSRTTPFATSTPLNTLLQPMLIPSPRPSPSRAPAAQLPCYQRTSQHHHTADARDQRLLV